MTPSHNFCITVYFTNGPIRGSQLIFNRWGKFVCLFACVEVLRPCQQLRSGRAGQLPINTVPGQA